MVGLSTNKAFCRANINSFLFEYEIWNWHLKCRAKSTNHICCQREPRYWNQSENSLILVSMMQLIAIWKCWWPFWLGVGARDAYVSITRNVWLHCFSSKFLCSFVGPFSDFEMKALVLSFQRNPWAISSPHNAVCTEMHYPPGMQPV